MTKKTPLPVYDHLGLEHDLTETIEMMIVSKAYRQARRILDMVETTYSKHAHYLEILNAVDVDVRAGEPADRACGDAGRSSPAL